MSFREQLVAQCTCSAQFLCVHHLENILNNYRNSDKEEGVHVIKHKER